jgi:prolyl oligopeptidase
MSGLQEKSVNTTLRKVIAAISVMGSLVAVAASFPETREQNVIDSYHGHEVVDPYQWLEDWSSPEVKAWSAAQNDAARKLLNAVANREAITRRVETVIGENTVSYYDAQRVGDVAFFMKFAPPRQQPLLVQIDPDGDPGSERVLFDPVAFDDSGSTSVEWYRVSPDGQKLALALTVAGAETADLYVMDIASGQLIDEVVPRVNGPTAGGDLSWDADSSGFYYTRYPRDGEKSAEDQNFYQQLWHRTLGTPLAADKYEIGELFDRIAEIRVEQHEPSGKVLVTMQYGDSGRFQLHVRDSNGTWHRVANYADQLVQGTFIDADHLLVLSRKNAPRGKFMRMDISALPATELKQLVAQSEDALASNFYGAPTFVVHAGGIYAKVLLGGPQELRVYDLEGAPLPAPPLEVSGVGQILPWDEGVLIRHYSYLSPSSWLTFDGAQTSRHPLSSTSPVDFKGFKVKREFAASKDKTRIPVNIIMAEHAQPDGNSPLLLTGYGGYGISLSPGFNPVRKVWLEQGGIIAIANLRGGGEYGEEWHRQGMLTKKQNVFDDFYGVMRYLVDAGYTSTDRLVIEGGSNGGLLMGAMITQHPGDFHAVISHVGIYDSLRVELSPNGAFNIPEFGTVTDPAHFAALYAYSPYHNVERTAYPAIMFMTGANDGRVDPMHSRKMTAMLQARNTSSNPVLLRTSGDTGHGSGTPLSETISQQVDRMAFLFDSLGMEYRPVD